MTDPVSSDNVSTEGHSAGPEAASDPSVGRGTDGAGGTGGTGPDVGGPAQTSESATEDAVVGGKSGTAGQDDETDDQGTNPL